MNTQIAMFVWPTWGPPGSRRPQVCPTLAPWILLSGYGYSSNKTWWCHDMETLPALLALCEGNPRFSYLWIPHSRANNAELWYFFIGPHKLLKKAKFLVFADTLVFIWQRNDCNSWCTKQFLNSKSFLQNFKWLSNTLVSVNGINSVVYVQFSAKSLFCLFCPNSSKLHWSDLNKILHVLSECKQYHLRFA